MSALTQKRILRFWSPLALTWLMMGVEAPFLAAVIARLASPEPNLAAHGVAFSIAILFEAPIIMIMSASTALASDRVALRRLKRFTYLMCAGITLLLLVALFTPAMDSLLRGAMTLPSHVADLTKRALFILLPWPAAIGYRRFYQGLLIRRGQTSKVAVGTILRLSSMGLTGLALYIFSDLPGAYVGAAALSAGVVMEGLASRVMARRIYREIAQVEPEGEPITYRAIASFYYPLALTSTINLSIPPMTSFFLGRAAMPLQSLAVMPVISALVFLFRAMGISYMEAAIALMGDRFEHARAVRRFAFTLALAVAAGLGLIAFTPALGFWYERVSGLTAELASFAAAPTMILILLPAASVLFSFQRAAMVNARRTPPITVSTTVQVIVTALVLFVAVELLDAVGAVAAASAMIAGSAVGNLLLIRPVTRALRKEE